ncbi:hypothetical protein ACHRV6_02355 [Flavobacterium sp. FlaQc-51]|uniref:hypothetical protein n=1 Tax=Flavobacterium sp. FlaQc-51 TaxID=3374184 RepID=UPI0037577D1D
MNNLNIYIPEVKFPIANTNFLVGSPKIESSLLEISKKPEFRISTFENVHKPTVLKTISVEEILEKIKNGDSHLQTIKKAREIGKGNINYDFIKKNKLPTYRFNFTFKDYYAKNGNILAPTGLIYLDADDTDVIPESNYVFAKWKSLSNTGYGVLVKVENLTKANYENTYNQLSDIIGIKSDLGARKLIQQTVLSFDSNLYHDPNSLIYSYIDKEEIKRVSFSNIKKEKKGISSNDTFLIHEDKTKYRNNNIDDYFKGEFADVPFLVFSTKTKICQPFIPYNAIEKGQRNWIMFSFLSNYASLNPNCDKKFLLELSNYMNKKMSPKLPKFEVATIIGNILKKQKEGSLEMYCNKERRILFNSNMKLTRTEKYEITGREIGQVRKDKTSLLIYKTIENWDFEANGKIIQKKVALKTNQSITTIKRYWHKFKDYVCDLNTSYVLQKNPS